MTPNTLAPTKMDTPQPILARMPLGLLLPSLWFAGVFLYLGIATATAQRQIDPIAMFALGQSSVVAGAMGAAVALQTRRRGVAFLLGFGTLLVIALLFIYFPMGVAECQEWVQHNVGAARR
jgi:hypothetical protein